jgi:hypothetical protein
VTWYPVAAADAYTIWRSPNSNFNNASAIGRTKQNGFDDKTAVPGKMYYYWVRSVKNNRSSELSNRVSGWRANCGGLPPAPPAPPASPPSGMPAPMSDSNENESTPHAINIDALLEVLAAWGDCRTSPCDGDLNDDGKVDINDLLMLLEP